jgi:hypothetical protein
LPLSPLPPTKTDMQTAIDDAVRPLTERIATLELEMATIPQVMDGRQRAGALPYTKTKTEAAREIEAAASDRSQAESHAVAGGAPSPGGRGHGGGVA